MMEEGKFPPPAANYTLETIRYNPRFMGLDGDTTSVLAVEQVPSGPNSGTIIAFAPAAETLEHAVRCLAHELFRFHPTQGENHDLCYQYAQAAVRVYNGGRYNGPSVEVEELGADLGAGFDAEADADLPQATSQAAPTPNPRPDREADTEVPTPSPSPNPRPPQEGDASPDRSAEGQDPAAGEGENETPQTEPHIEPLATPFLGGPVGASGNAVEDVALVQAALSNVREGGAPYWSGGVNGSASPALQEAIKKLEAAYQLPETGTLAPGAKAEAAMVNALPPNLQNMRAIPETSRLFYVKGKGDRP